MLSTESGYQFDSKKVANKIATNSIKEFQAFTAEMLEVGVEIPDPTLAVIFGHDPESVRYFEALHRTGNEQGVLVEGFHTSPIIGLEKLTRTIYQIGANPRFSALIAMAPFDNGLESFRELINNQIPPRIDVDFANRSMLEPIPEQFFDQPTPTAIRMALEDLSDGGIHYQDRMHSRIAVVGLGQVGMTVYESLVSEGANVVGVDKHNRYLLKGRNIIIAATGSPKERPAVSFDDIDQDLLATISVGPTEFAKGLRGKTAHISRTQIGRIATSLVFANTRKSVMLQYHAA